MLIIFLILFVLGHIRFFIHWNLWNPQLYTMPLTSSSNRRLPLSPDPPRKENWRCPESCQTWWSTVRVSTSTVSSTLSYITNATRCRRCPSLKPGSWPRKQVTNSISSAQFWSGSGNNLIVSQLVSAVIPLTYPILDLNGCDWPAPGQVWWISVWTGGGPDPYASTNITRACRFVGHQYGCLCIFSHVITRKTPEPLWLMSIII